jgi:hypothetical protein
MNQEFAHALSGKPEAVTKYTNKALQGYRIREMLNSLYTISTIVHLNKWRTVEKETEDFWVISEKFNIILPTRFIFYKTREVAEEHLKEIK